MAKLIVTKFDKRYKSGKRRDTIEGNNYYISRMMMRYYRGTPILVAKDDVVEFDFTVGNLTIGDKVSIN